MNKKDILDRLGGEEALHNDSKIKSLTTDDSDPGIVLVFAEPQDRDYIKVYIEDDQEQDEYVVSLYKTTNLYVPADIFDGLKEDQIRDTIETYTQFEFPQSVFDEEEDMDETLTLSQVKARLECASSGQEYHDEIMKALGGDDKIDNTPEVEATGYGRTENTAYIYFKSPRKIFNKIKRIEFIRQKDGLNTINFLVDKGILNKKWYMFESVKNVSFKNLTKEVRKYTGIDFT